LILTGANVNNSVLFEHCFDTVPLIAGRRSRSPDRTGTAPCSSNLPPETD
jgi:hypothetical protein